MIHLGTSKKLGEDYIPIIINIRMRRGTTLGNPIVIKADRSISNEEINSKILKLCSLQKLAFRLSKDKVKEVNYEDLLSNGSVYWHYMLKSERGDRITRYIEIPTETKYHWSDYAQSLFDELGVSKVDVIYSFEFGSGQLKIE